MHPTDGNNYAISKYLHEIEAYESDHPPVICDECGEEEPVAETVDAYGQSFGASHMVCQSCYNDVPESYTGRPDWHDLL